MAKVIDEVQERMAAEGRAYAHGEDRPLGGYVRVMAVYGSAVVGLGALVGARRIPLPERPGFGDLALVALATAKLARLTTRDSVTSPLRAPFTRFEGPGGPAEVKEQVRGDGVRHAIGELVTCPFCVSQWVATGFTFGLLFAPRATRQVAGTLAALELADLVQFGRGAAEKAAA
jgi:hypothetical protein